MFSEKMKHFFSRPLTYIECIKKWAQEKIRGPHAERWLAGFSFAESSFFPIPPDLLLLGISGVRKGERWLRLAIITTTASVLGGIFGYMLGMFFFDAIGVKIVTFYGLEHEMERIAEIFSAYAFWAIFTAGFTPIPYKIFTMSAGLFQINFVVFIVASVLSRGLRFFIVSYIAGVLGRRVQSVAFARFQTATALIAGFFVCVFLIVLFFKK